MKPAHYHIRVKPEDGTIWLTLEKPRERIRPIKDITNDVMFALCADLSADGVTREIERSIRFSDGLSCRIHVSIEEDPHDDQPATS